MVGFHFSLSINIFENILYHFLYHLKFNQKYRFFYLFQLGILQYQTGKWIFGGFTGIDISKGVCQLATYSP